MSAFRLFAAVFALALSGAAPGQNGERGSLPPGQSKDGSAPSDGAIKGGSILPGETAGVPAGAPAGIPDKRCEELSGSLREDCLKQQQERPAGIGETKPLEPFVDPSGIRKKWPERAD